MFCQKCGKEIMDEAVVCVHCGCAVNNSSTPETTVKENVVEDKANAGLVILSILIPIVGVILWPVKHGKTPKAALTYGLCGIISWVVSFFILMGMGL